MIGYVKKGTADERFYYVKDHLGSIRMTIDENSDVISARDYYAYGEELRGLASPDPDGNKYQFTEKERDSETELDYFGARYYDSELGRWTSVDPLADKYPGWSPYNYTLGNPLKYIDPDGKEIAISIGSRKDGTVNYVTYRNGNLYQGNREYNGNNKFAISMKNTLNNIVSLNDNRTSGIISKLSSKSGRFHLITETAGGSGVSSIDPTASNSGEKTGSRIRFNLASDKIENGLQTTPESNLGHELEHANDFDQGNRAGYYEQGEIPGHKDPVEIRAVNTENGVRGKQGLEKRTSYGKKQIDPKLLD